MPALHKILNYNNQGWQSDSALLNPESNGFFSADFYKNPKPEIRDISVQIPNLSLHNWKTNFTQFYFFEVFEECSLGQPEEILFQASSQHYKGRGRMRSFMEPAYIRDRRPS